MSEDTVIWKGTASQLTNFWTYIVCGLLTVGAVVGGFFFPPAFALLAIPLAWAGWIFLTVRCRIFELTEQRLRLYEGVLNRRIDEIELYRVKDTAIELPFWLRMFGLGNVVVDTSDRSHPVATLVAISDPEGVREKIRARVEALRDKKRVREIDFEGGSGDEFDGDFDAS